MYRGEMHGMCSRRYMIHVERWGCWIGCAWIDWGKGKEVVEDGRWRVIKWTIMRIIKNNLQRNKKRGVCQKDEKDLEEEWIVCLGFHGLLLGNERTREWGRNKCMVISSV